MSNVEPTTDGRSVEAPFVVARRLEVRPFADAVMCVRVHRRDGSPWPSIVVLRLRGGAFDCKGDGDEP